eukprot:SAG31_NODE_71_length_28115_cov_4.128105_21_plen_320_part_00
MHSLDRSCIRKQIGVHSQHSQHAISRPRRFCHAGKPASSHSRTDPAICLLSGEYCVDVRMGHIQKFRVVQLRRERKDASEPVRHRLEVRGRIRHGGQILVVLHPERVIHLRGPAPSSVPCLGQHGGAMKRICDSARSTHEKVLEMTAKGLSLDLGLLQQPSARPNSVDRQPLVELRDELQLLLLLDRHRRPGAPVRVEMRGAPGTSHRTAATPTGAVMAASVDMVGIGQNIRLHCCAARNLHRQPSCQSACFASPTASLPALPHHNAERPRAVEARRKPYSTHLFQRIGGRQPRKRQQRQKRERWQHGSGGRGEGGRGA